jgi:hypothetical protein
MRIVERTFSARGFEGFLKQCNDGPFLVAAVDNLGVTSVSNELCEASDRALLNALGIHDCGEHCPGRVDSGDKDCHISVVFIVADEAVICDEQWVNTVRRGRFEVLAVGSPGSDAMSTPALIWHMSEAVGSNFGCTGYFWLRKRFGGLDNDIVLKVDKITLRQLLS